MTHLCQELPANYSVSSVFVLHLHLVSSKQFLVTEDVRMGGGDVGIKDSI